MTFFYFKLQTLNSDIYRDIGRMKLILVSIDAELNVDSENVQNGDQISMRSQVVTSLVQHVFSLPYGNYGP